MTSTEVPEAALYRRPALWPEPGTALEPARAASMILGWLTENREYLLRVIDRLMYPDERGRCEWEPADVIARLAVRARRGRGLTASLAAHADGSRPIGDPQKILLKHAGWMVQEYRKEYPAENREVATCDVGVLEIAAEDVTGDHLFAALVEAMESHAESAFTIYFRGHGDGKVSWAQYLAARLPALQRLFEAAAPPNVTDEVRRMAEDDRTCILLGVFPLHMRPLAVATYREAQGATTSTTEEATRQRIARLRYRLASVWPHSVASDRILRDPRREARRGEGRHGQS